MLYCVAFNVYAMKRARDDDADCDSQKYAKIESLLIKWLSYSEFLSEIYHHKSLGLQQRIYHLCKKVFSFVPVDNSYQMWLRSPNGDSTLWCFFPMPLHCRLRIFSAGQKGSLGNLLFQYDIESFVDEKNIISRVEEKSNGDFSLRPLINELLFLRQPDLQSVTKNQLTLTQFKALLANIESKSLIEKIQILNNGQLGIFNEHQWKIEIAKETSIVVKVSLINFRSNCLSELNFLGEEGDPKPNELFYYEIALYADYKFALKIPEACSIVIFALDAGYGKPALPCELHSLRRERNISGKENLAFTSLLFELLRPKVIYLRDFSQITISQACEPIDIFILRPLMCGMTFYAELAGFEVVNSNKFVNTKNKAITQSRQLYRESLRAVRALKVSELIKLHFNDTDIKEELEHILRRFGDNDISIGDFLAKLYKQKSTKELQITYEVIFNFRSWIRKKHPLIDSNIKYLCDTNLWESKRYARKSR
jgi:hypothetical protein